MWLAGYTWNPSSLSLSVFLFLSASRVQGQIHCLQWLSHKQNWGRLSEGPELKGSFCLGEEKCSHLAERWPGSDDGGWQGGCSDCCLALIEAANEANLLALNPRRLWGFGNTSEQRWVNCSLCCLVAAFFLTCPWIPVIRESGNAFHRCSMAFFYFGIVDLCQIRGLEQVHNH